MRSIPQFHEVTIRGLTEPLTLPVMQMPTGVSVAVFDPLGDWQHCETLGHLLATQYIPKEAEVLLMPAGKAGAIFHAIGVRVRLPTIVARAEMKPYMGECFSASAQSMTANSRNGKTFYLEKKYAEAMEGRQIVTFDDVYSTGSTNDAMKKLIKEVGGHHLATVVVFTEGETPPEDPSIRSLGHLPIWKP